MVRGARSRDVVVGGSKLVHKVPLCLLARQLGVLVRVAALGISEALSRGCESAFVCLRGIRCEGQVRGACAAVAACLRNLKRREQDNT